MQGKKAISRWIMQDVIRNAPVEWQTAEALATFDREAVQASITIDKFTFVNEEATALIQHIQSGMTGGIGILEAVPYRIELYNKNGQTVLFDGMIDLSDGVEINEFNNKVTAKLRLRDELYTLEEKIQCLSFGYLAELGEITSSDYTDIHYVVQKKINILETIIMGIALYMMTKELIDAIIKITKDIGHLTAHATGGLPSPFSVLAGIIFGIILIILEILYAALLLIAIIKLSSVLISQLAPIKRKAKTINFKTAITKVCTHLGYVFQTNIPDMDNVYYLPSNFDFDSTTQLGIIDVWKGNSKGIPSSSDYGYNCADFFELAKKLFNGKYAIIDGKVCFYNTDDPFWNQYSSYQMPSVRDKIKTYNTDELKANRYLVFDVDFSDEWTIKDYEGTAYEVITNPQITNDIKLKTIKGLDEIRFGASLGSRKDVPYGAELFLQQLASVIDGILQSIGGQAQYVQMLGTSIGLMTISTNNWLKPKVLKVDGNKKLVPRSSWSAKYIYENYYIGKSFVSTVNGQANYGQKEIYRNVKIPFGLDDFILLIDNSYITLPDGSSGKIMSCKYRFSADHAIIDYYLRKPYTANLKETFIEPTNQD
ncbi:MAG: hypothetical protein V1904_08085 [Bacteroidota bacterium]